MWTCTVSLVKAFKVKCVWTCASKFAHGKKRFSLGSLNYAFLFVFVAPVCCFCFLIHNFACSRLTQNVFIIILLLFVFSLGCIDWRHLIIFLLAETNRCGQRTSVYWNIVCDAFIRLHSFCLLCSLMVNILPLWHTTHSFSLSLFRTQIPINIHNYKEYGIRLNVASRFSVMVNVINWQNGREKQNANACYDLSR